MAYADQFPQAQNVLRPCRRNHRRCEKFVSSRRVPSSFRRLQTSATSPNVPVALTSPGASSSTEAPFSFQIFSDFCSLFVLTLIHRLNAARRSAPGLVLPPGRRVSAGGDQVRVCVVYCKGELSKAMMDRQWPHQVALPAYRCLGHNYLTMRFFCEGEGLSLCPRTHSLRRDDQDVLVFSFAKHTHAEQFRDRFSGDSLDSEDRPMRQRRSSYDYAPRQPLRA